MSSTAQSRPQVQVRARNVLASIEQDLAEADAVRSLLSNALVSETPPCPEDAANALSAISSLVNEALDAAVEMRAELDSTFEPNDHAQAGKHVGSEA